MKKRALLMLGVAILLVSCGKSSPKKQFEEAQKNVLVARQSISTYGCVFDSTNAEDPSLDCEATREGSLSVLEDALESFTNNAHTMITTDDQEHNKLLSPAQRALLLKEIVVVERVHAAVIKRQKSYNIR